MNQPRMITYEDSPWDPAGFHQAPARRVTVHVAQTDAEGAAWTRFDDPISRAIQRHLSEHACADVFWNSDSFGPRHPTDDARITIHQDCYDPDNGLLVNEFSHSLPLPTRAARAMWRLRTLGIAQFRPFNMRIDLPLEALANTR